MEKMIKKLRIGNVVLDNNLILAPMAGVTDLPFRLLCREQGAGLVCTEMVSAKAIYFHNKNTEELMAIHPNEGPVSLQLFGSDADIVSEMAKRIEEKPFSILDINMGCPVPKVVNNGEGSALMKNPKLVEEIITKTVKAVKKPVTIKIRKGFDESHVNAVEIARIAEGCGAAAVAVHGRTREQYYMGEADWDIIARVKEAVQIPVIGNGNITDGQSAKAMLDKTGCDGLMIGRAVRGNPWIFGEILWYLGDAKAEEGSKPGEEGKATRDGRTGQDGKSARDGRTGQDGKAARDGKATECGKSENLCRAEKSGGERRPEKTAEAVREIILRHAKMELAIKGEYTAVREMRKHIAWYTAGYPNSAALRRRVNEIESFEKLEEMVEEMFREA